MTTVKIRRGRLYPVGSRPGPVWTWSYEWAELDQYGQAGDWHAHGIGLGELRNKLHAQYGRTVTIIEPWRKRRH